MYSLCALIGKTEDLERKSFTQSNARLIGLGHGFSMIPLSEGLLGEVQRARPPESAPTTSAVSIFEFLTPAVESWIRAISSGATLAYVETEYFAGEGYARSALWRDGQLVLGPLDGAGAVNQALRALGVPSEPGKEEFDVVGLGRHRSLDEWLGEA